MSRAYNFNAGPAALPLEVLEIAQKELTDFNGTGMSIMEHSHRGKAYDAVHAEAVANMGKLLGITDDYQVLFLQGGASLQFSQVPLNLLGAGQTADYVNSGAWASKAIKEAKLFGEVEVAYSSEDIKFVRVPTQGEYTVSPGSEYLYLVSNNTIYGTAFPEFPVVDTMLISDMSSDILSRQFDVSRFGLIFAGAQKNLGPAGVTVVVIREDLLDRAPATTPTMLNYKTHAEKGSMFNTPPCFAVYVVGLVLKWLKKLGGVPAIEKINREKAALLYAKIDESGYYRGHAEPASRSLMNVTFNLATPELEAKFIAEATAIGLNGLKGHRSVGGCRASIYNAFPREGVVKLVEFMREFERANPA